MLAPETVDVLSQQTRERSTTALRTVPISLREHTSITLAVTSSALPRAFELAARFRQQLVELLQEGVADDVYQIDVALFPVTTLKREGKDAAWDAL